MINQESTVTNNISDMVELPQGWVWTTIAEVTQPIQKIDPGEQPESEFVYLDISSIDNSANKITDPKRYEGSEAPSRARQQVRTNDVLFSTVRTYLRNIAQVPEAYDGQVASTGFAVLRAEACVLPLYLFYFTLSDDFLNALAELQRGTSYPAVRDSDVREQPIPLPPLAEQQRIVNTLEEQFTQLDAGIASLKAAQTKLKRYRAAVLTAACEGALVPQDSSDEPASILLERILAERRARWEAEQIAKMNAQGKTPLLDTWKAKYAAPTPLNIEGLPELPTGWTWASLDQCCTVERGRFSIRPRNDPRYYDGPYPFVQIGDLPKEGGKITSYAQSLNEKGLKVSKMFAPGTILIAIVGATIGNTGILTFNSCCPDSLVAIETTGGIQSKFVELYLQSRKLDIRKAAYASGGQPNINLQTLLPFLIPLPPLAEQQRIVAEVERRLSVVDEMDTIIAANLKRAERLRQSILKRAFEGKLVQQDASDEPASVTLERVRVERAAQQVGCTRAPRTQVDQLTINIDV